MSNRKVNDRIQKFFNNRIEQQRAEAGKRIDDLQTFLTGEGVFTESENVDKLWECIVSQHAQKNIPLKLIILGEAPLESKKYFYNNPGTFLDSLRDHWNLSRNDLLPEKMLEKGVLVLDVYKYPIPSEFYKKDKDNVLFDETYVIKKIELLRKNQLISDEETHFVFRYKELLSKRKLHEVNAFKGFNFISHNEKIASFNAVERPQKLNDVVKDYLNNCCP